MIREFSKMKSPNPRDNCISTHFVINVENIMNKASKKICKMWRKLYNCIE